jgi:SAM-dependent methyltransferase
VEPCLRRAAAIRAFTVGIGAGAGNTPRTRVSSHRPARLLASQLKLAQERLGISERYIYVAADVYRLPFTPGLFDAATMIRTLHHLQEPALALEQVRQVLQPGAIFILEYANKRNLKAILRYWLGKQSWNPFSLAPVEFAELNFDFHPRAVRLWLTAAGFKLERQLTVSHFRVAWMKRLLPLGLLVKLDALFQWTGAWWQLTPSVFLRSTVPGETVEMPAETSSAARNVPFIHWQNLRTVWTARPASAAGRSAMASTISADH